jgi:hypothetical protein
VRHPLPRRLAIFNPERLLGLVGVEREDEPAVLLALPKGFPERLGRAHERDPSVVVKQAAL